MQEFNMALHSPQQISDESPITFVFTMNKGTIDVRCEGEGCGQAPTLGTILKLPALVFTDSLIFF